jgi:hypothetical protein
MSLRKVTVKCLLLVLTLVMSACGPDSNPEAEVIGLQDMAKTQAIATLLAADGFKVVGLVDTPTVWTGEQIRAMEMIEVPIKNSSGAETVYQGVPIIFLLSLVGVQDQSSSITMISENGSETEVMLVDINACINCIVAPEGNEIFSVVLPGIQPEGVMTGVVQFVLK